MASLHSLMKAMHIHLLAIHLMDSPITWFFDLLRFQPDDDEKRCNAGSLGNHKWFLLLFIHTLMHHSRIFKSITIVGFNLYWITHTHALKAVAHQSNLDAASSSQKCRLVSEPRQKLSSTCSTHTAHTHTINLCGSNVELR